MGFRTGAYAKVWEVNPTSDTTTKLKLSISRKNKQTNEFETEWNGFALVVGTAAARSASKLGRGDTIKLGDVDVTRRYDKESGKEYINWKIFSFAPAEPFNGGGNHMEDEPALPF